MSNLTLDRVEETMHVFVLFGACKLLIKTVFYRIIKVYVFKTRLPHSSV